jgi:outer membrane lipoprotein SlyB
MTSDRVYRVTLRMDDGSTQVVTQDATPDFRSGDRVSHSGGAIKH